MSITQINLEEITSYLFPECDKVFKYSSYAKYQNRSVQAHNRQFKTYKGQSVNPDQVRREETQFIREEGFQPEQMEESFQKAKSQFDVLCEIITPLENDLLKNLQLNLIKSDFYKKTLLDNGCPNKDIAVAIAYKNSCFEKGLYDINHNEIKKMTGLDLIPICSSSNKKIILETANFLLNNTNELNKDMMTQVFEKLSIIKDSPLVAEKLQTALKSNNVENVISTIENKNLPIKKYTKNKNRRVTLPESSRLQPHMTSSASIQKPPNPRLFSQKTKVKQVDKTTTQPNQQDLYQKYKSKSTNRINLSRLSAMATASQKNGQKKRKEITKKAENDRLPPLQRKKRNACKKRTQSDNKQRT